MRYHVTLSLILFTLISGCSKTDNHDTNSTTPAQEQSALQAPVVENAPESTTNSSVTVTVRTLPNCEVYLGNEQVATSDSDGIAYVTLELNAVGSAQSFSFKVKENNRFSDTVVISIQRVSEENSVSSASSQSTSQTPTESESNSAGVSSESLHVSSASSSSAAVVVVTTSSSAAVASQGYHVSSSVSVSSTAAVSSVASSSQSSSIAAAANPLKTLTLTADTLELPEGNTTALHVSAFYDNNSSQILNEFNIAIADPTVLEFDGNTTLTALKEGTTALHVSQNTIQSNPLHVTVYKEISGHRLPPEPDETLNNSTLLGIDTNNNGVRDDVERKIYLQYSRPIEQAMAMYYAKSYQFELSQPLELARESTKFGDKVFSCKIYLREYYQIDFSYSPRDPSNFVNFAQSKTLNTKKRIKYYFEYDQRLSGGVYGLVPKSQWSDALCDFNITQMLQKEE